VPGEAPVISHAVAREEFLKLTVAYLKVQWGGPGTPLHELATAAFEVCNNDTFCAVRMALHFVHLLPLYDVRRGVHACAAACARCAAQVH
jgi:hypothetical protein